MSAVAPEKSLAEVADFQRGLTYAKSDEVAISNTVVLRATNIDLKTNALDLTELRYISDKVLVPSPKMVRQGSLLICTASGSKSHLGKVALIDRTYNFAFGGFMGMLTPHPEVLPKYLFYSLTSPRYKDFIDGLADGANINNLKFSDLGRFKLPVPPLAEQKRIVAILDQALQAIGIAFGNTNKNVLKASDLLASYLRETLSASGDKWEDRRLGDVVTRLTNGYVGPTRNIYRDDGVPYLLARHVKNNTLLFDGKTFVSDSFNKKHSKSILRKGDVLLVQSGHIGHSAVVPQEHDGHNCHAMIVITPANNILDGQFLSWYFTAPDTQNEFWKNRTGSTVPHLNCGNVREMRVPIPPIGEQRRIAEEIDEYRSYTSRLGDICRRKASATSLLRKSLLNSAMSGAL